MLAARPANSAATTSAGTRTKPPPVGPNGLPMAVQPSSTPSVIAAAAIAWRALTAATAVYRAAVGSSSAEPFT